MSPFHLLKAAVDPILKIYNGYWFFGRPTIEELRQDLRAVLKKCRPDWDITRPGLKAAWARGERDRFYPYGKTYGQVFRERLTHIVATSIVGRYESGSSTG
jgi:hypothetical protein